MISLVLEGFSFVVTIAVLTAVARRTFITCGNYLYAILGTIIVGAALSVGFDFTLAYSTDGYVRSFASVLERAATSVVLSLVVAFFTLRSFRKNSTETKMGWFSKWLTKVDIGLRPRNVFVGTEVNLCPFTPRGIKWLEQNVDKFGERTWSKRDRCLMLSDLDCLALMRVVEMLLDAGLKVRFYGRLKGWDGRSPF